MRNLLFFILFPPGILFGQAKPDSQLSRIEYPQEARDQGIEGEVLVRILISEQGTYIKHEVIKSPNYLLTQAVEQGIPHLVFTPAYKRGKPIKCWVTIPFNFQLDKTSDKK